MLGVVGLESVADQRVGRFSLGMGQRLGIAVALLGDPAVVVLDEPVNGLDPEGIRWVRTLARQLADEGRTVFVSSHLMAEMALTAEHLVVIGRGRVLADCPTADFIARHAASHVRVRSPRAGDARRAAPPLRRRRHCRRHGELRVQGIDTTGVGDLAGAHGTRAARADARAVVPGGRLHDPDRRQRRVRRGTPPEPCDDRRGGARPRRRPRAPAGLRHVLRAEWIKFWSVRSTTWSVAMLFVLGAGLTVLVCATSADWLAAAGSTRRRPPSSPGA